MKTIFGRMNLAFKTKSIFLWGILFMLLIATWWYVKSLKSNHLKTVASAESPNTLIWGTINPPSIINPVLTSHSVSAALLELIFDSLIRIGPHGEIIPNLATSWDVSNEGKTYTFYLKKDVYFHNGEPLTADDIKFTYDLIMDSANESHWRSSLEFVQGWRVLNPWTIAVDLKYPKAHALNSFRREIISKALYYKKDLRQHPSNEAPIGSGPFKFVSWDKQSQEIILEANADYHLGRPKIDRIIVKTFQQNDDLWAALMRQEVDFVKFINKNDYDVIVEDKHFRAYAIDGGMHFLIHFNTQDSLLKDKRLRWAINYALDRKSLMDLVKMGGEISNGPFAVSSEGFNPNVEVPYFNPEKSLAILRDMGWRIDAKTQILNRRGKPLQLTMLVANNQTYLKELALAIRQQLSSIGIKIKIIAYDDEQQLSAKWIKDQHVDMILKILVRSQEADDESDSVRSWYSKTTEFGQWWKYHYGPIDSLYEKGLAETTPRKRKETFQKLHQLIYDEQPSCFLFYALTYSAVSSRVNQDGEYFTPYMPDYLLSTWSMNVITDLKPVDNAALTK